MLELNDKSSDQQQEQNTGTIKVGIVYNLLLYMTTKQRVKYYWFREKVFCYVTYIYLYKLESIDKLWYSKNLPEKSLELNIQYVLSTFTYVIVNIHKKCQMSIMSYFKP